MLHRRAAAPAAAALLALTLPATAAAVDPQGGHYAQSKKNVIVVTFDISQGKVRKFSHNDSCARFGVPVPAMKVGANGSFSFEGGGIKNGIDQEYTVHVTGKTAERNVITGKMTYTKTAGNGPNCSVTTKFRAKRTGKARAAALADTVRPQVTLAAPTCTTHGSKHSCTLRGMAGDAAPSSGLARVQASATRRGSGAAVRGAVSVTDGSWTLKLENLSRGSWTFRTRAIDGNGNVSARAQRKVRLR